MSTFIVRKSNLCLKKLRKTNYWEYTTIILLPKRPTKFYIISYIHKRVTDMYIIY